MRQIEDYITLAREQQGSLSNNELGKALGLSKNVILYFTKKGVIPSDETILKLADLAGISEEEALLDVSMWRSQNNPRVSAAWKKVAKRIIVNTLFLGFFLSPALDSAEITQNIFCQQITQSIYIMSTIIKGQWRKLALFTRIWYNTTRTKMIKI